MSMLKNLEVLDKRYRMNKRNFINFVLITLLFLPFVSAINVPLVKTTQKVFDRTVDFVARDYSVVTLILILLIIILYAIYSFELRRIDIPRHKFTFSRRKRFVIFLLSLFSVLSIYYFTLDTGIDKIFNFVLKKMGVYGVYALAVLIFFLVYAGIKDKHGHGSWKTAMFSTALIVIIYGSLSLSKNAVSLGLLFLVGAMFGVIIGGSYEKSEKVRVIVNKGFRTIGINIENITRPHLINHFGAVRTNNIIFLFWEPNPMDKVAHYQIQRKPLKAHLIKFLESWEKKSDIKPLPEYWTDVSKPRIVHKINNPLEDIAINHYLNSLKKEIAEKIDFQYRIRAVGINNNPGPWRVTSIRKVYKQY
jgi:hypothetical protein